MSNISENFDTVKSGTERIRIIQRLLEGFTRSAIATENFSNTQFSKLKTEREKLYQKVQDIHNYKAEYEFKCEAEAALESDLYRLGQLDGGEFVKANPTLWHEWSYKKGYGVGIEEYHNLAYAS